MEKELGHIVSRKTGLTFCKHIKPFEDTKSMSFKENVMETQLLKEQTVLWIRLDKTRRDDFQDPACRYLCLNSFWSLKLPFIQVWEITNYIGVLQFFERGATWNKKGESILKEERKPAGGGGPGEGAVGEGNWEQSWMSEDATRKPITACWPQI